METVKDELQFYSKFTRPLIFHLPDANDRVRAAGWVKKIREDGSGTEKLKTDYIKLLLFALQRKKLVGIFADDPERYDKLEAFPSEFDLNSMAKNLIEKEKKERVDRIRRQLKGQIGDYPPLTTDCSSDYREYAAAQDIPGFGVHCYYAISKEPLPLWQNADKGIYPKITKSAVDATSPEPPGMGGKSDTCVCPSAPGEEDSSCKARAHKAEPTKKKRHKKKLVKSPPTQLLGTARAPDERTSPSWSSNLMDVRDDTRPKRSQGAIPKQRTEKQKKRAQRRGRKYDDSDIEEEIHKMEDAMSDFRTGEILSRRRRGMYRSRVDQQEDEYEAGLVEEEIPPEDMEADWFGDLERSQFQDDLDDDAHLIGQFRDKLSKADMKRKLAQRRQQAESAAPAGAGVPLTTPKPSLSPQRLKSSEKLYASEEQPGESKKLPILSSGSRRKDPGLEKLYADASAVAGEDAKRGKTGAAREERQRPTLQPVEEAPGYEGKPMTPIQKGSTQANQIFSHVVDAMESAATQRRLETPPTPPIFSRDPRKRELARAAGYSQHLLQDVDRWVPGPEYFANINEFEPFDPREKRALGEVFPELEDRNAIEEAFFDFDGEPPEFDEFQQIDRAIDQIAATEDRFGLPILASYSKEQLAPLQHYRAPRDRRRPIDEILKDIPEDELGPMSPRQSPVIPYMSMDYVTPEHQRVKQPTVTSPSPYQAPASPKEMQLPAHVGEDSMFFDREAMQMEDFSPFDVSPGDAKGVNILTVQEISPQIDDILSQVPPENIFDVEAMTDKDFSSLMDEAAAFPASPPAAAQQEKYMDLLFGEDEHTKELLKRLSNMMGHDVERKDSPGAAAALSPPQPAVPAGIPSPDQFIDPGYAPPMYLSPGTGILGESPPLIGEHGAQDIRRDIVLDPTKEQLPIDMREFLRRRGARYAAADERSRAFETRPPASGPPRAVVQQKPPRRVTPKQVTPEQAIMGTPRIERRRIPPEQHPGGARGLKRTRLTERAVGRRLDFNVRDPEEETSQFIRDALNRSKLPPLTPPEQAPLEQRTLMDQMVPVNLPSPIRPPVEVPGWKTPPRFTKRTKTPSPYQVVLPPVQQDQWFFDLPDEPPLEASPTEQASFEADFSAYGELNDATFFDIGADISLASGKGSGCGSPVCPGAQEAPPPEEFDISLGGDDAFFFERSPDELSPMMALGPSPEISPRPVYPSQRSEPSPAPALSPVTPEVQPLSPVGTPLRDMSGALRTPSPGDRTPVTRADRIFQEAGFRRSPIEIPPPTPPSPGMQMMLERVRQARGRRGIRAIREAEEEGRNVQEETSRMEELRNFLDRRRAKENEREIAALREQRRFLRGIPAMPGIREQHFDPEHGLPTVASLPSPKQPSEPYSKPTIVPPKRRPVFEDDPMQVVIDDIIHGRMTNLDAIEFPQSPGAGGIMDERIPPGLPSPMRPAPDLQYTTPERLKVQPISPVQKLPTPFFIAGGARRAGSAAPRSVAGAPQRPSHPPPRMPIHPSPRMPSHPPTRELSPQTPVRRQLFKSPSPQPLPVASPVDMAGSPGIYLGSPLRTPDEAPERRVVQTASQRRFLTVMLPQPNITPTTPEEVNLSDSRMAEDETNFRWMDK